MTQILLLEMRAEVVAPTKGEVLICDRVEGTYLERSLPKFL